MWEHFLIDNPKAQPQGTRDEDYDEAEASTEGYETPSGEIKDKEHRLPLTDKESFADPDFDAEWDTEDEEDNSDIVGENSAEEDFQTIGDESVVDSNIPMDFDDDDEWKEV